MLLVTGHPRSGTGFASALLQAAGVDAGHEIFGKDGIVSWLHAGVGHVPWIEKHIEMREWDKIIHLVRHPLKVISSAATLLDESFGYMFDYLDDHPGGRRSLKWYMWSWLKWNEYIEKKADAIIKVEDLSTAKGLSYFLELTGGKQPAEMPPPNVNSRPHKKLTWRDLEMEDPELCLAIQKKAVDYGYRIFKFGAVMMAKNEAHNLPRCLDSIQGIVDEIILVDTGSEDDTVKIAESYGAKVYHHPWQNNFSLHRNQSLQYSTCDWVLQIDCDEELCGDAWKLREYAEAVGNAGFNAMAVLMKDIQQGRQFMQFNAARIFNREAVHFEDIVHNRPVFKGDAAMPSGESPFWLQHYGYDLEPNKKVAKLHRTKALLEKRIQGDPEDWTAYFYLSQIEGELGNVAGVLNNCEIYIKNRDKCEKFNRSVLFTHLQSMVAVNGYNDDFESALHKYMNELPNDLDITFFALQYAKDNNKTKLLRDSAERFIRIYDEYAKDAHRQASRFTYSFKPECLAMALFYTATLALTQGVKSLEFFSKTLPETEEVFRGKAMQDMELACKNIGVTWVYKDKEQEAA